MLEYLHQDFNNSLSNNAVNKHYHEAAFLKAVVTKLSLELKKSQLFLQM
jgi:hypothetical protein